MPLMTIITIKEIILNSKILLNFDIKNYIIFHHFNYNSFLSFACFQL